MLMQTKRPEDVPVAGEAEGARRATGASPAGEMSGEGSGPDPEVVAVAKRRSYTAAYKQRILREAEVAKAKGGGEVGALLRREGLYSSHLDTWRRQRERGELAGLAPKKRGRKAKEINPLAKRVAELERNERRLLRKLQQQQVMLDIQKKVSELLGIPLQSPESDDSE